MHSLYDRVAGQSVERLAAIVLVQVNYAIAPRFCWAHFCGRQEAKSRRMRIAGLAKIGNRKQDGEEHDFSREAA